MSLDQDLHQIVLEQVTRSLSHYRPKQIVTVLEMLMSGNTVPFIARYRKDQTGSLDEVAIREIEDSYHRFESLEKRKAEITNAIQNQEKMTPQIQEAIEEAGTLTALEDIYRPFKQKRRTKATIAKEAGLEPLAEQVLNGVGNPQEFAQDFLNPDLGVLTLQDALEGAHEIMAERIGDDAQARQAIRDYTKSHGRIVSRLKDQALDPKGVYANYYDYQEPLGKIAAHRILALNRAEKEEVLKVNLDLDGQGPLSLLNKAWLPKQEGPCKEMVALAVEDAYKRFIGPAIEREIRSDLSQMAEDQAINVFGDNLSHLLLQAPMKGQVILGLDPAYRTGCKLAVIDETGKVLAISVIYPHAPAPAHKRAQAGGDFRQLIETHGVTLVAIGNGTASRESEQFVAQELTKVGHKVLYTIVSEAGASVYSASDLARSEFPDLQVEERSAISIARRLQDPLAELVKIDPKAVGVGQYQHDVSQKNLDTALAQVVETAVNRVGVNVNTASAPLLEHVAGLTKTTAANLVAYREQMGKFQARDQLMLVPRLGPKAFEQSVGFLRILDGVNPLDKTEIHPESYDKALALLEYLGFGLEDMSSEALLEACQTLNRKQVAKDLDLGLESLDLILAGLTKPGRDPRDQVAGPLLRSDVLKMEDLMVGMELEGTVRNVVDFGAFVDIGVKQDGLVHISLLQKGFVKHPSQVVSVGDIVKVWVKEVDVQKGRISLTMLEPDQGV